MKNEISKQANKYSWLININRQLKEWFLISNSYELQL